MLLSKWWRVRGRSTSRIFVCHLISSYRLYRAYRGGGESYTVTVSMCDNKRRQGIPIRGGSTYRVHGAMMLATSGYNFKVPHVTALILNNAPYRINDINDHQLTCNTRLPLIYILRPEIVHDSSIFGDRCTAHSTIGRSYIDSDSVSVSANVLRRKYAVCCDRYMLSNRDSRTVSSSSFTPMQAVSRRSNGRVTTPSTGTRVSDSNIRRRLQQGRYVSAIGGLLVCLSAFCAHTPQYTGLGIHC